MTDSIVMNEMYMEELRNRNAIRLEQAKEKLGEKYLLHPANKVKKVKAKRKYAKRKD